MDWKLANVVLLGLAFMLLFTAFQTASMCSKFITDSIRIDLNKTTNMTDEEIIASVGDGYISMSLVYGFFSIFNFFAPAVVKVCGHKAAMFGSSITYLVFIVMFLFPNPIFMYTASSILGLGAAVIWTSQGDFLHMQSDNEKLMSRNTGIFWCMFQLSLVVGNLYIYFSWQGVEYVDNSKKNLLFTGLSILAGIGCGVFLLLKAPFCGSATPEKDVNANQDTLLSGEEEKIDHNKEEESESLIKTITDSIIASFSLLFTRNILLIAPLFLYSGFSLGFFSNIYPTSVANTKKMPSHASMLGLVGVGIGIGQVLGGGVFVFGSKLIGKLSRVVLLNTCLSINVFCLVITYANIPREASIGATDELPAILATPSQALALITAFLLGLGDAGLNNVIYTTISSIWSDNSTSAFALMKCLQSAACAVIFAIQSGNTGINLVGDLIVLFIFAIITAITYIILRRNIVEVPRPKV